MKIPFVDLKTQYQGLKKEIDGAIQSVINDSAFIKGRFVDAFETNYARKYGTRHCIGVANGTEAIYICLLALGIGRGDEVITVANSWISTSETITQTGAKPVFVDIDPAYYTIDINRIEKKINQRTKAILPVHLYGQPAEIDAVKEICEKHGLFLIEDCAQAHFAEYQGQRVGTFGVAGTFSFYPGKNLGAYGDAGAIITNDDGFAEKARMIANHGALKKHHHVIEGINSRLDGLQAAILDVKLNYIDEWNAKRHECALSYNRRLSDIPGLICPQIRPDSDHIFHLYVIRSKHRDKLRDYLKDKGISSGIHYPVALPFLPAYAYLKHVPGDFPWAYQYQSEILSLPMYPELTDDQMTYVSNQLKNYFDCR